MEVHLAAAAAAAVLTSSTYNPQASMSHNNPHPSILAKSFVRSE